MPIKPIDIEELTSKAKNIHEAIVAMSKRSRQVNEEMKIEFNRRVDELAPKIENPENPEEVEINPDQLKVSLEFERRPKPTDVALDELMHSKLEWRYKEPEETPKVVKEEATESDDE